MGPAVSGVMTGASFQNLVDGGVPLLGHDPLCAADRLSVCQHAARLPTRLQDPYRPQPQPYTNQGALRAERSQQSHVGAVSTTTTMVDGGTHDGIRCITLLAQGASILHLQTAAHCGSLVKAQSNQKHIQLGIALGSGHSQHDTQCRACTYTSPASPAVQPDESQHVTSKQCQQNPLPDSSSTLSCCRAAPDLAEDANDAVCKHHRQEVSQ